MPEKYDYDLVIIGSGPGGYVAAIRAAQLGLKTAVIEKEKPGGVCLNIGCIPSKALIEQARIYRDTIDLSEIGVSIDTTTFKYEKVFQKSRDAADKLSKGVQFLLKKNKVEYIEGTAKFVSAHEVSINGERTLSGKNILIATGSRPRELRGFEFDGKQVMSSNDILMMKELPESLMILGAGAIGAEFAYVFNAFGVKITLVEMLPRILPLEDPDSSVLIHNIFKKRGMDIRPATKAVSLKKAKGKLEVTLQNEKGEEEKISTEKLLVAVGRVPNSENLGLEDIGVQSEKGFIKVGDYYETGVSGVYAIGDVINTPQLAHLASKEGETAVEHMAGHKTVKQVDPSLNPFATYSEPQVASFGPNEERAKKDGIRYEKAVFPYRGAGKAVAVEKPEGFVKILFDPDTREIISAHIAGAEATDLIHELLLAKKAELLPEDIATMIHAHPSLSEAVMEAARAAEGWVIHI